MNMGKMIKRVLSLFIAFILCIPVVGCGARNKDYSEINKIFKNNGYTFNIMDDCAYAYVYKDDARWVMVEGRNDLYYRDVNKDSGSGVVDLKNKKLYSVLDYKEELTNSEDKKRAEKYIQSSEEKLKKLDLTTTDVITYLNKKWSDKKKEYGKLSKKERLKKEFDNNFFDSMPSTLIDEIYKYYSKNKFKNYSYETLCKNFVNEGPYSGDLAEYNKSLLESDTGSLDISINSIIANNNNMAVFYELEKDYSTLDCQFIMVYSLEDKKLSTITCRAPSTVEKSDFYVWSCVLMKLVSGKQHTATEWLSLLANSISNPIQVGDWVFQLSMGDEFLFIGIPA